MFNCYPEQPNIKLSSLEHENQTRTTTTSGIKIPIRAVCKPLEHTQKEIDECYVHEMVWFGLR